MNNNENNNVNVTPTDISTTPVSNPQPVNPQPINPQPTTGQVTNQGIVQSPVIEPRVEDSSLPSNTVNVEPNQHVESKDERLKRIENNYKPPSKVKVFFLLLFFGLLIAFVFFLPDISFMIKKYQSGELNAQDQKITDGRLVCELTSNSTNLTYEHKWKFNFSNNQLNDLYYTSVTTGDVSEDEQALDDLNNKCKILSTEAEKIDGVSITCEYTSGKLIEIQNYEYASINEELLGNAFVEAGGNKPTYQNLQDMDLIERDLNARGAKCKRER